MNKKIVILPASTYQIPFVKKAIDLGIYVITIDNQPNNPCHSLSHKQYCNVSTLDYQQIIHICRSEDINGILSPCSDVALFTVASVAEALNLSGPNKNCIDVLTSKISFRTFQKSNNIRFPKYQVIDSLEQEISINFPLVIKPDRSSGSKGIYRIYDKNDINKRYKEACKYSLNGKVLIEEEIKGRHFTAEGVISFGQIDKIFISDRLTAPAPYVATWGHIMPSIYIRDKEIEALRKDIEYIFKKLNYTSGPFDADIVIDEFSRLYILEIAPRVGGNSLSQLIYHAYGFDIVEYAIFYSLNENDYVYRVTSPMLTKIKLLGSIHESIIDYDVDYVKSLHSHPNIKYVSIDYKPGDRVQPFINGRNRAGEVIISAHSKSELDALEFSLIDSNIKFRTI